MVWSFPFRVRGSVLSQRQFGDAQQGEARLGSLFGVEVGRERLAHVAGRNDGQRLLPVVLRRRPCLAGSRWATTCSKAPASTTSSRRSRCSGRSSAKPTTSSSASSRAGRSDADHAGETILRNPQFAAGSQRLGFLLFLHGRGNLSRPESGLDVLWWNGRR